MYEELDRQPPQSIESEMAVLGSILIDNDAIVKVLDFLYPEDFYKTAHQTIYQGMLDIFNAGEKIELMLLAENLDSAGLIEKIGGRAYLAALTNTIPTSSGVKAHAKIVKDKSIRRKLLQTQMKNSSIIYDEDRPIDTVIAETQGNLVKISNIKEIDDSAVSIIKELDELQDEYQEKYRQGKFYLGIPTGIGPLDNAIDGLRPGHVWVVGGWTSTGKTQFALNIVNNVLEQNIPVSIVSLEMSRIDTAARIIGIRHNLSSMRILKGKNDLQIQNQIAEGKWFLQNVPLKIHTTYFDIEEIKMLIRKEVYTRKVKLVVIDYIQNILSEKDLKEYNLITQAATDLQALAHELQITIYIVSQINNESQKGQGAGAGFKGTGTLEAVADLAIRLRRDRDNEKVEDEYVPVKIEIAKNRHGFTGEIKDYFMWLSSGKFEPGLPYVPRDIQEKLNKPKKKGKYAKDSEASEDEVLQAMRG